MTPVQLVLLVVVLGLVAWVGWSWVYVGSKYPLRPKQEWADRFCGECRFRATEAHGRCGHAQSPFAGWYVQPDHPACETWQPEEEKEGQCHQKKS